MVDKCFLVQASFHDILNDGYSWFLDYLTDAIGYPALSNFYYKIVEAHDADIIFKVTATMEEDDAGELSPNARVCEDLPLDQLVGVFRRE